jgi:hypothetical protein
METQYQSVALPQGPLTASALINTDGFNRASRQANALHKLKLVEAARMWQGFMAGEIDPFLMKEAFRPSRDFAFDKLHRLAPTIFNEAMTRSDFTNLTTYVLDRMMLDNYGTFPFVYSQIAKVHRKVRDFRSVERWVTDGGERTWQVVGELEGFNRGKVDTSSYTYTVAKYEGGDQISWEAVINDDMDMFADIPKRLALGGGRTVELFFTKLIADANGPHASFYTSGNKNIIDTSNYAGGSVNPVLNYNNLAGALAQFMNLKTSDGRPINAVSGSVNVMVGDGYLHQVLMNIINTQYIASTVAGGSKASSAVAYDTQIQVKNWLSGRINPIYNPELVNIVTASGVLAKSWWIFAGNDGLSSRPAVEIGHLQGYDTPQLFRKLPNTVRVSGGGTVDEMGDFETMGTELKGMVVVGGTREDPKMTLASNGAGS